jgi:hypothetical protein
MLGFPSRAALLTPSLLTASLLLPACVSVPPIEGASKGAEVAAPAFPVDRFFAGRTEGEGVLTVMMSGSRSVRVSSRGRTEADGAIALDQTIWEQGKPARSRSWWLRQVAPGRYAGTLSDAAGPITGEARGGRLHLRFKTRGGMKVDQWLTLAPDGRSARNVLRVRKLGLTVAALEETIRKLD